MIGREQLATLSRLWDEAQPLDAAQREAWLAQLPREHAALLPALRTMLCRPPGTPDDGPALELPTLHGSGAAPEDADASATHQHHGDIVGPYRLIGTLGDGGMSTVWLAERNDGVVKRPVALKLPHPWVLRSQFRERIEREREILERLAHPRIARLYDAGVSEQGQPWLALEYVQGRPITAHCDCARMGLRQRLELFVQVLEAVGYAHERHIVHRDIKPSNILVTPEGEPRLLDFGIAKLLEGSGSDTGITQLGPMVLTPSHASPEQVAGEPVGAASDVYSLGVLLYELLCGRRPYRVSSPSRAAIEAAIMAADVEPPSARVAPGHAANCGGLTPPQLAAALRGDLDAIVLTALQKRPARRYASVAAFAEDLRRHLDGRPVLARPVGRLHRSLRLVRRHRMEAAAVGAVTLSLAAGLVLALWQAGVAREQRRTAESALGFLETVFLSNSIQQADPLAARATTARQLLDQGARDIETALDDAPEAKLRLQKTLSRLYAGMGLWEQSLQLARERAVLARGLYRPGEAALIDAQLDRAEAAHTPATAAEASAALDEVAAQLDRLGDQDSLQRGRWLRLRAGLDFGTDRDGARSRAGEAVKVLRGHKPGCELLRALEQQGSLHVRADDLPQARAVLREALVLAPTLPACEVDLRAPLQSSLCWAEGELGEAARAEPLCREALVDELRLRGAETPVAVVRTVDLATRLMRSSRLREAIELMQGVAPAATRLAQTEDFGEVNILWFKLGEALVLYGRPAEGLAVMERPSRLDRRVAERATNDGPLLERKAAALIALGRHGEAAPLLDRAQELFPRARYVPRSAFNTSVALRVRLLLAQGRPDEAARALHGFYLPPGREATLAPDALEQLALAAEVALAQRQPRAARALAETGLQRIATAAEPQHHDLWSQRLETVLGRVALASGQARLAEAHFGRALQRAETLFDAASPALAAARRAFLAQARSGAAAH